MTQVAAPPAPAARTEKPRTHPAVTRRETRHRSASTFWPPLIVFVAIIAVWSIASALLGDRSFLLPAPYRIFTEGLFHPSVLPEILRALGQTTLVAFIGLAIAVALGVSWAIVMLQAKWIERSLYPYAVILQCIPILALVPLIGFWFGYGLPARVIVCVLIALFPMVSNTLFGLQSVEKSQRELFQLKRVNRWTTLWKLQVPTALPSVFIGLRTSAGLAVVGAIVGDFFFRRGTPGLGSLMSTYTSRLLAPQLYASVLVAALLGVVIFLAFGLLSKLAVGRWYDATKA
ncbi:ABC transporter permease [Microbacterium amylolyticum]|uniref:NitT/TauT family transport system permease protein n=1 Tax=Microbacterium amylolyticum TaxID=936337 RepID=A0ABS4ZJ33_9MICO|nr:ABC transporter permease [Microbacterium amylolyticum]MBP2437286.1 NitT/TauT family transport system permease protein [Microbacterium amylolyticum]